MVGWAPRPLTMSLSRRRGAAKSRAGLEKMPRPRFARHSLGKKGGCAEGRMGAVIRTFGLMVC